jgi:tRNA threonylcarbamoyladenosine biosynthesis protein TsaE
MKGPQDFLQMGFDEYFTAGGICAIEWPERIESVLPKNTLKLTFSHCEQGRKVTGLP